MSNDASSFLAIDGIIMTWLLDCFFVLTNFFTLSDTLLFKYFFAFLEENLDSANKNDNITS